LRRLKTILPEIFLLSGNPAERLMQYKGALKQLKKKLL